MKISLIITNWNGLDLLKKNFETAITCTPEAFEIIFADDASSDSSVRYVSELQKKYAKIKIVTHKNNLGFSRNSNHAVKKSSGEYIILFNNDITPHPGFLQPTLKHFQDPAIFGVGFSELGHENYANIFWKEGYLQYLPGEHIAKTHISGWVSGGSSIIRKKYFDRLGGFDNIYHPFYSEDLDLGYRAWKSGYKLLWEPKSIVEHHHESTMSRFPKRFTDYVKERNRLLVVWRNITDPKLLASNRLAIISRCLFGPNYLKIILAANRQINKFPAPIVFPKRTDADIFNLFAHE
jgi:GT2 family glycosyltransferase